MKLDVLTNNHISGALALAPLREQVLKRAEPGSRVVVNLSGVQKLSGLDAAALLRLVIEGKEKGIEVRFSGLSAEARQAFTGLDASLLEHAATPTESLSPIEEVGEQTLDLLATARRLLEMIGEITYWFFIAPWHGKGVKWERTGEQIVKIGLDGVPIVSFLSFLIGAVLALNAASQLRQFGASIYIANLVGVSMTREMAPLLTAIIAAGRSGSAITAELGTMVVSEEIDAMRTMALSPGRFLLLPRVLALLCAVPCLTVLSNLAGIFGGYWVGVIVLGLGSRNYLQQTSQALLISDLVTGMVKSTMFALLIGLVSCYRGFYVHGGAEGVGTNTTASVVTSIVLCILADAVFTTIFFYFD
ncbi:MAG: MlaE family lipid ABC transporter permease subunit [Deltaproteobacteria bacterium]|nr:MlaE family lipid ABC transporter permease subunit [Deltaproteobacteria bacterium]